MATLYELTGEYRALMDAAFDFADDEGQLSPEFVTKMRTIEGDIDVKLEGYCRVLRNIQSDREAFEAEADRLKKHAAALARNEQELKDTMKAWLIEAGTPKRKVGVFALSVVNNSQAKVNVLSMDAVPAKFDKVHERELVLSAIAKAVAAGEEVPGVEVVRGNHLRVA